MINTARLEAIDSAQIPVVLLWDEEPTGDGPGGTSDFESPSAQPRRPDRYYNPMTF
jgi:hypothetical protein